MELQPHSSSVSPPTAVDPVADVAQTIVQGEEWGAAARAAEAAEGAARRMREAADKRAADAVAARRAGTMTRVEAAAEVEAALQTMVTPESAEDARMMQSPMDEEARELGFSLPLSFSEARSAAALLSTPKRTPGQKMVMVDQRTLGAASDLEEFGTPEETPSSPKTNTNTPNPVRPLMMFGETDRPEWGTGGLDKLAEQVAEHVVREGRKATAEEEESEALGSRCQEALTSATHYTNLEWGAKAAAAAVEAEAAEQLARVDQLVGQAETAVAAMSALTASNLGTEDPSPSKAEATPSRKKGAAPKKRGKWDTGAPLCRGRPAAKLR